MKTRTLLSFMGCLALGALHAESAKHAAARPSDLPDPNAWSIHLYRLPADDLIHGFVTRERGQIHAPAMPKADASPAEIEKFLRQSHDVVSQYLASEAAVPLVKGSLAAFDPVNKTLAVRTLNSTQSLIDSMTSTLCRRMPNYLTFNTHLVETDAATLRGMVKEATTMAEHRALWEKMQALIDQGKAREIGLLRIETRSGQRVKIERGELRNTNVTFGVDGKGWNNSDQSARTVGTELEMDPVIGPDSRTIDLSFALKHHYAPPAERWPLVAQGGTQKLEANVMDFYTADVTTAITLLDGMTKMLGVWKPDGAPEPERAGNLQAAFLTGDIVTVEPVVDDRVLQLLKTYGEKVEPTPPPGKPAGEALPNGMTLRRFRVPPTFLSATPESPSPAAAPADSFAPAVPRNEPHGMRSVTAADVLKIAGIPFPQGSSANFDPSTAELLVRNTPENQEKVAAYVDSLLVHIPKTISCTLHIVQADTKTLRGIAEQTRRVADHAAAWKVIEDAAAQGRAKILTTSWLETRSGQRAASRSGAEYITLAPPNMGVSDAPKPAPAGDKKEPPSVSPAVPEPLFTTETHMTPLGTKWEVDPVIGPDGETIDVSVAVTHHYAPPTFRYDTASGGDKVLRANAASTDFHKAELSTAFTLSSGMIRLIGIWKPEGAAEFEKGDVLQAAFFKADIVAVEEGK